MSPGSKTVFIFGHLPANPPFWKRLSLFHDRVYQKEQALEVSKCSFLERTISYELHAVVLVLWNQAHIKRYHLVRDQVKCSMWPVKMATGHFPTESHNFAWNGHVNIDGMTTVTLQTKYDPTLPSGYPKVAYPVEMSSGSGIYSDAVSHLPAAQPPTAKRPADHVDVVYRDVIAGSRESRGHHYDAPFIYRILKSLLPQNNAFFIATASVVKDALDTTDCERLREQWYTGILFAILRAPHDAAHWYAQCHLPLSILIRMRLVIQTIKAPSMPSWCAAGPSKHSLAFKSQPGENDR